MAELTRLEVQDLPELCVIGREIRPLQKDMMGGSNPMPAFWGKCFSESIFKPLEEQKEHVFSPDYVGFMSEWVDMDTDFSYVVGMLMKTGAKVPGGYVCKQIAPCRAGVAWVRGENEGDAFAAAHALTEQGLKERGLTFGNMTWCMELYNCPRFTMPDEQGRVTLDYYIPLD